MDKECEETLVRSFFIKSIQERFLFELSSPKKRKAAIGRLSHRYRDTMNEKYMIEIPKPNNDYKEIEKILKKYGAEDFCYSISLNTEIDEKRLLLINALEKAVGFGLPSIISCIPGKLAYFESEQEYGAPPRFILKKNT